MILCVVRCVCVYICVVAIASASVYPVPTVVVPSEFIPLGKTANYTCVFDGKFLQWLVRVPGVALLALIPNGSVVIANIMSGYGIATDLSSPFVLTVNASYLNNGTILECTSVSADVATLSSSVVINVFGKYFIAYRFFSSCMSHWLRYSGYPFGSEHYASRDVYAGIVMEATFLLSWG